MKKKYIDIVQKRYGNATEFFKEVSAICKRIGISNPEWLADVMYIETAGTFRTDIKNPGSSATGLIQFMESTAKGLGTSTAKLRIMGNIEQLKFVEKYMLNAIKSTKKPADAFDVYCLVFYPAWVGKPDTSTLASAAYAANKGIDINKDGKITRGEFRVWANKQVPGGFSPAVIASGALGF